MTIGYPAGLAATRVLAQDRATASILQASFLTLGPTTFTLRWTYTVPTAKLAQLDMLWSMIVRQTAAGALALNEQWINITLALGTAKTAGDLFLVSNTVGVQAVSYTPTPFTLFAGDSIDLRNQNTDTGGSSGFGSVLKGFEYSV